MDYRILQESAQGFDFFGFSPAIILLIVVGIFVFLKIMKYAVLILLIAVVYMAWRFNLIPGFPA